MTNNEEIKLTYKIVNVVATASVSITERIDLNRITRKYTDVDYNPERFPGLIMHLDKPKATILVFSTGKMVITGLRDASEAPVVVEKVIQKIQKCEIALANPEIMIQNLVASGDLKCAVDLNLAAVTMEYAMYEPEVFPGLIYRMQEPRAVFLIFSTGRIVCTGIKSKEIAEQAMEKLFRQVREQGLVQKPNEEEFGDINDEEDFNLL